MTDTAFSAQDALVALMITVSASDATIRTSELLTIQAIVNHLPIFAGYDEDRMEQVAQTYEFQNEPEPALYFTDAYLPDGNFALTAE